MMMAPRGLRLLVAAATLIGGLMVASLADAQVFKPRSKTAVTGKSGGAAARKASPAATASKKPARASGPTTRKASSKKRHGKARGDRDDDVKIQDDDDDVKITDD
jgi:hypothetical protein